MGDKKGNDGKGKDEKRKDKKQRAQQINRTSQPTLTPSMVADCMTPAIDALDKLFDELRDQQLKKWPFSLIVLQYSSGVCDPKNFYWYCVLDAYNGKLLPNNPRFNPIVQDVSDYKAGKQHQCPRGTLCDTCVTYALLAHYDIYKIG